MLESIDYLFQFIQIKATMLKDLMLQNVIYQNVLLVAISGKNFYDQTIDSDIKRYQEIRQLTARQGEDYTTEVY